MSGLAWPYTDDAVKVAVKKSKTLTHLLRYHYRLLMDLQRIHDSSDPSFWKEDLRRLAKEHNLSDKVLEKFDG